VLTIARKIGLIKQEMSQEQEDSLDEAYGEKEDN